MFDNKIHERKCCSFVNPTLKAYETFRWWCSKEKGSNIIILLLCTFDTKDVIGNWAVAREPFKRLNTDVVIWIEGAPGQFRAIGRYAIVICRFKARPSRDTPVIGKLKGKREGYARPWHSAIYKTLSYKRYHDFETACFLRYISPSLFWHFISVWYLFLFSFILQINFYIFIYWISIRNLRYKYHPIPVKYISFKYKNQ